jgi:PAS domain S-box-containing protein
MSINQNTKPSDEKEEIYQNIFGAIVDGLIVIELSTGLVVEANQAAAALHGYAPDEFIGFHVNAILDPTSHYLISRYTDTVQSGNIFESLVSHIHRDGFSFQVEWRGKAFTYQDQSCLLAILRDVTRRIDEEGVIHKWVEERTREQAILLETSEAFASALELKPSFILEQIRGIIDYTHAGLFTVEDSTLVVLTTHNPKELEQAPSLNIQLDVPDTLTSLFRKRRPIRIADINGTDPAAELLRSFLKNEAAPMLRGMQSWMWIPLEVKGRIIAVIGLAHSEQDYFKERHADLAMTLANQAAIALVNVDLIEDAQALAVLQERQHLARNLHDAVNQSLFSAGLIAEVLPRLWDRDQTEARSSLEDLRKLIRGAIAEMRMLVAELRPLALSDNNLTDLLHQLANAFTGRTNIPVAVNITGEDTLLSGVQAAFYRICQEALNNIAKHAGASRVRINLQHTPEKVEMHVQDNGRGFDPSAPLPGHYGLDIMNERAHAAGAKLKIISHPDKGTEVILIWQESKKQESK